MGERTVIGASVAALVAADALAAAGHRVELLATGTRLGGGFAPMHKDGRALELGVRLLELSYEGTAEPPLLSAYRPGPAGHRDFVSVVASWVRGLLGDRLLQVDRPQMYFEGRIIDDLYFTTDPRALREALGAQRLRHVAAEVEQACRETGSAAGVLDARRIQDFEGMTFAEASLANHGRLIHELMMAPLADKFAGDAPLLASHRRKVWLPLFWPETLRQVASGQDPDFVPDRPFHRVRDGAMGEVVQALLTRMSSNGVRVRTIGALERLQNAPGGRLRLSAVEAGDIELERPVLACSPEETFRAIGVEYRPTKARTAISWVEVADADILQMPSVLTWVDRSESVARISTGSIGLQGTNLFTVELRHDTAESRCADEAVAGLVRAGIMRTGASPTIVRSGTMNTFPLPSPENAAAFDRASQMLQECRLAADVVGSTQVFGSDAFGEQVLQGLLAAEENQ